MLNKVTHSVITMIVMHHIYSQLFMMNSSDHPIASFVDIVITLEEIRPRRLEYHNKFSWRSWYVQSGAYSLYSGRRFELRDMVREQNALKATPSHFIVGAFGLEKYGGLPNLHRLPDAHKQ